MEIVKIDTNNFSEFVNMAHLLFPKESREHLCDIYNKAFATDREFGYFWQIENKFAGIMHISIRHEYVNGTDGSPVVFIEAIYVLPQYRKMGIGKHLLKFAENFAKERGIKQIASDCYTDNAESESFHKACGFEEKERVICFAKDISI